MQEAVAAAQMKDRLVQADQAEVLVGLVAVAAGQIGPMTEQDNPELLTQEVEVVVEDLAPQQAAPTLQPTEPAVLEL